MVSALTFFLFLYLLMTFLLANPQKEFEIETVSRKLSLETDYRTSENVKTYNGRVPETSCPKGYYRPRGSTDLIRVTGQREDGCVPCPAGRYGNKEGLTDQFCSAACPAGTYSDRKARTSVLDCKVCPVGRFGSTWGLTSASCTAACPVGRYTSTEGNTRLQDCQACPFGYRGWQCTWAIPPVKGLITDHLRSSPYGYPTSVDPLKQSSGGS